MRDRIWVAIGFVVMAASAPLGLLPCRAGEPAAPSDRYVLNYPAADRFSPPVATYFDDLTQEIQKVGGRTFHHQLNGGYGLPVVDMVEGKHLLRLGADVAWYRAGEPVYAMAAGVVRVSLGPPRADDRNNPRKTRGETAAVKPASAAAEVSEPSPARGDLPLPNSGQADAPPDHGNATASEAKPALDRTLPQKPKRSDESKSASTARPSMGWGNLIVIEHHLSDGSYVTSIYGHLGPKRLVPVGDVVQAGQMIGSVGKAGQENGGFKPHLHFGLREGRMYEPGCSLLTMRINGKPAAISVADLTETDVELTTDTALPTPITLPIKDHQFMITSRDGKLWMPAAALNYIERPDFPITGYALSAKGWRDPSEFLMQMLDKFPRAPFGASPQARLGRRP
jgi:hypothetical protein